MPPMVEWRCAVTAVYYIATSAIASVGGRAVRLAVPLDAVVNED